MTQLQVLSVLLNGGSVVRKQPALGKERFVVTLPGKMNDQTVGHISQSLFEKLMEAGLLYFSAPPKNTSDGGLLMWYKLGKGDLSFLDK